MNNFIQYLVLKKSTNKFIKQFDNYDDAVEYCKELKNKYMVVLIVLDTSNYQVVKSIIF